ncbi:MAG: DUF4143 domain-containing protein [Chlorobiaceae bacterium]
MKGKPNAWLILAGLLAILLDFGTTKLQQGQSRFRKILEAFVYVCERLKHNSTAEGDYKSLYYRDLDMFEVYLVLTKASGQLIGVEVKTSATVNVGDLRSLKKLASVAGGSIIDVMGPIIRGAF